ncbi:hypothetical protein [Halosimplex pelagicum]|uniref:Uncharacterized protein n=1 Tax=Halosimplex pelagicum TaxID=869886 RepID=A0A7D5PFX4_9EURY|nr:hypothetical protein [Halosimplex pelagicum]QLH83840.1 hypothetical protein HZS54_20365 [Halosimplex pelagicum]
MKPLTNQRDAARAVLLPLDCSAITLQRVLAAEQQEIASHNTRFEQYLKTAHRQINIKPTKPTGTKQIRDLATFAALGALRTHSADPLADTKYEAREPNGSAEARMLRSPIRKHPGLTEFSIRARNYYVATITWLFENKLPSQLQAEIAAVLLAPDPPDITAPAPFRTYAKTDSESIDERYRDRAKITTDGVWIDTDHYSRCCQLLPVSPPSAPAPTDQLQHLYISDRGLVIPREIFRLKLAEYAWHGWAKLVNLAYNMLSTQEYDQLASQTPHAEDVIFRYFKFNNLIYSPYFASKSENPQRDWQDDTNIKTPPQLEDKRLITIVDCIRATPSLSFGTPLPVQTLFNHLKTYFPPPRRPGNDINSQRTLFQALQNAKSSQIKLYRNNQTSQLQCEIPAPPHTPIYPRNDDGRDYWNSYLHIQSKLRQKDVEPHWSRKSGRDRQIINPTVPKQTWQLPQPDYHAAIRRGQKTAAQAQSTIPTISDVEPLVDDESKLTPTQDELKFLTRVGLAMERQIADYSLTDSMRVLRRRGDGTQLNVDEGKLQDQDWLERHTEGRKVLYTVPADKRKLLSIKNVSNDGYGERTTSEKSLHRRGIDQTAAWLATKPDVTRVVRYHDLWRLRSTPYEEQLKKRDLLSTRIDVIGFNESTPRYVAEVETKSNSPSRAQHCVRKLNTFSTIDDIQTILVTPNPEHLWKLMRHLDHPDYFDFTSFPNSNPRNYGRTEWKTKLQNEDILGQFFDQLETYRSLVQSSPPTTPDQHQDKIIGNL